jgi:hypothetical protein
MSSRSVPILTIAKQRGSRLWPFSANVQKHLLQERSAKPKFAGSIPPAPSTPFSDERCHAASLLKAKVCRDRTALAARLYRTGVGTIRRECLDHLIVLNQHSLFRRFRQFHEYY